MMSIEQKIGYEFVSKHLLKNALCHTSYANENRHSIKSNERLEFLGDSVLSIVVSEYLFKNYKNLPEGELTKTRAMLVCEKSLFDFAKQIDLGSYILLGKGELASNGNQRASILADAFEALIAAIYLDSGLENAKKFILSFISKKLQNNTKSFTDYKTILQEIIQQNPEEIIRYEVESESGPDHDKVYKVNLRLNSNIFSSGTGKSKKSAEQAAAKEALELMGIET